MTKTTSPQNEEASVAALLWAESEQRSVAPGQLGGQSVQEQEQIVQRRAERDGVVLTRLFVAVDPLAGGRDRRLWLMLELAMKQSIRRLYVPRATFAHDIDTDVEAHVRALRAQRTDLVICDE